MVALYWETSALRKCTPSALLCYQLPSTPKDFFPKLLVTLLNDSSAFSPFWKLLLWSEFPCPSSSPLLRADHFHWLIDTWVRGWPSLDSDKSNGPFQHHLMFQGHLRHYYDFIPTQLLPSSLFCFILHKWWLQEHSLISFFLANFALCSLPPMKATTSRDSAACWKGNRYWNQTCLF